MSKMLCAAYLLFLALPLHAVAGVRVVVYETDSNNRKTPVRYVPVRVEILDHLSCVILDGREATTDANGGVDLEKVEPLFSRCQDVVRKKNCDPTCKRLLVSVNISGSSGLVGKQGNATITYDNGSWSPQVVEITLSPSRYSLARRTETFVHWSPCVECESDLCGCATGSCAWVCSPCSCCPCSCCDYSCSNCCPPCCALGCLPCCPCCCGCCCCVPSCCVAATQVGSALIAVDVPATARVEVNGYATKSKGVNRSYVCRGLAYGEPYVLNMVVTANGVATRKALTIHAGESRHVAFSETLAAR